MTHLRRLFAVAVTTLAITSAAACAPAADEETGSAEGQLGQSEAPLARFKPHMQTLRSSLESGGSSEQIAKQLVASGRKAAFNLQALGRVYGKVDPRFKELESDFKGLEDGIGNYQKWDGFYQAAVSQNRDAATRERLKRQADDALVRFTELLTSRQWLTTNGAPTRLKMTEDFLNNFNWKSRDEDRRAILDRLIKETEEMKATTYDMTILEYGNGVHELKRDLRWILIEEQVLNGMITVKNTCSVPAYAAVPNNGGYGSLPRTAVEPNPCELSGCLVFQAAKLVSDLDDVKEQAETEVNLNGDSDVVPERLQAPAKAIYDDITHNDLIGAYIGELKACRDALGGAPAAPPAPAPAPAPAPGQNR